MTTANLFMGRQSEEEGRGLSDDTVRLSVVGQIIRKRWRLLAVFAIVGALVGAGASLLLSPGYETSTFVLLQGPRQPTELKTETQVAMSSVVLDRTAKALNWGVSGVDLLDMVKAEVGDGNIIKITGTASTPEKAQQLADRVAKEYVAFSTQLVAITTGASVQVVQEQQENLRQQVEATNKKITELHTAAAKGLTVDNVQLRTDLEALRTALTEATTKLGDAQTASTRANVVVMAPAERPTTASPPSLSQLVIGGAVLGLLFGVFGHLIAARLDKRLRGEPEIVAALGTVVLGSVDVPDEPPGPAAGRWPAVRRWFLRGERPWDVPEPASSDQIGRDIRYRRVLTRLNVDRVLVVVADDDEHAHRAVARLALAAGNVGPTRVVTENAELAELVLATRAEAGAPGLRVDVGPADGRTDGYRTVLTVVAVPPGDPTVPDEPRRARVLGVVTAGSRTAWELVGIAEACTDAGHDLAGALIIHRSRRVEAKPAEPDESLPQDAVLAGSS
jgi:capsular polysaccharide biosynthesis protein